MGESFDETWKFMKEHPFFPLLGYSISFLIATVFFLLGDIIVPENYPRSSISIILTLIVLLFLFAVLFPFFISFFGFSVYSLFSQNSVYLDESRTLILYQTDNGFSPCQKLTNSAYFVNSSVIHAFFLKIVRGRRYKKEISLFIETDDLVMIDLPPNSKGYNLKKVNGGYNIDINSKRSQPEIKVQLTVDSSSNTQTDIIIYHTRKKKKKLGLIHLVVQS